MTYLDNNGKLMFLGVFEGTGDPFSFCTAQGATQEPEVVENPDHLETIVQSLQEDVYATKALES